VRRALVLAIDGCYASSVTALTDVFALANQFFARGQPGAGPLFAYRVVSPDGAPVTASSGLGLAVNGGLPRAPADVVFLPAFQYRGDEPLVRQVEGAVAALGSWLVRQHAAGATIAAGCSGAFIAAQLGLLDGKVATTSWWLEALFRRRYPRVDLRLDELVTEDGRLLCAGPVNAHFNLALRLVERAGGLDLALQCARALLVDANRCSQLPYAVLPGTTSHHDPLVERAEAWMRRHLREPFDLPQVARAIGASHRNLIRRFRAAHGRTPIAWLQDLRVETAKRLLESTRLDFDAIVARVGYQDASSFRRLFRLRTELAPREYRRRFASRAPT
jgi:transcriptional regulator GlxA family with amidase domain